MNMLELLNPMAEDTAHCGCQQGQAGDMTREATHAAESLMLMCAYPKGDTVGLLGPVSKSPKHEESWVPRVNNIGGHVDPAGACNATLPPSSVIARESVRSPVVLPAHANAFHISPMAHKITPWSHPPPVCIDSETSTSAPHRRRLHSVAPIVPLVPIQPQLKRRLCSVDDSQEAASNITPRSEPCLTSAHQYLMTPTPANRARAPAQCSITGCLRSVSQQGKCALHKAMKLCHVDGCSRPVQSRGCCKSHGGGARCKQPGCPKGAISKGRCRSHGGGTRCAVPSCLKWAQRFGCCVRHSKSIGMQPV